MVVSGMTTLGERRPVAVVLRRFLMFVVLVLPLLEAECAEAAMLEAPSNPLLVQNCEIDRCKEEVAA